MSTEQSSTNDATVSYDQDKYQLALDAVIKQMNLLADDPLNENLRLPHEQAKQTFIHISKMQHDEYEKIIRSKRLSRPTENPTNHLPEDRIQHIEQRWPFDIPKLHVCYFISILFLLVLAIICVIIGLK